MPEDYNVDLYHHLRRARYQLDSGKSESLFYAALELRFGIEARIQAYLNAREDISKKKKKGWKVASAGRQLDQAFADGLKIVELVIYQQETSQEYPFFHTPIGPDLRTATGRIGDLLHAQKENIPARSPRWEEIREELEHVFALSETLAQGTLLAPPLKSPTGLISVDTYYHVSNPIASAFGDEKAFEKGDNLELRIAYHEEMPSHAIPYLNSWGPHDA